MTWVYKHNNTNLTAGWVGWSQEMLRPALLPRFRERKEEGGFVAIQIPTHFDIIDGSLICAKILSPSIGSPFYCCTLSLYRGSFNVSIGMDEASCAGLWSRPYFVAPL